MVVTLSAMFILVLFGCGTANHGSNSLAPSEEISADNNSLEEEIYEDIKENEDALHRIADLLLEKEKIGRDEFEACFNGQNSINEA